MTSKLYIAKIGGGDLELTSYTGRKGTPFFDGKQSLIEMGMRFANGEAAQGSFKLMDPDGELPRTDFEYNLPAHKLVTWIEDAPGAGIWLARTRTASYEGGRGLIKVNNEVDYDVTVMDGNMELRGQAFTEKWERPEETDFARIAALRAYTLNGSGSTATNHRDTCSVTVSNTHLCPNTNTVTMPAKTYPVGTQPQDVVQECADAAGKVYGVVPHHAGGSHLCLQYILETDHSTNLSTVKISDQLADLDPEHATAPVYPPHWEAGKATLYQGEQLLSGLVSTYALDQSVFVENAQNVIDYDYWVETFYDAASVDAAQAAETADGILLYRSKTHVTHRVSVIMLAEQVDLVATGMSLEIKAVAANAGQFIDTYQMRRIAECKFEPMHDGRYWAHLELDRAQRRGVSSAGKSMPAATGMPKPGIPIPDTGTGTGLICTPVPTAWIQGDSALWDDGIAAFDSGAISYTAPSGSERVEGIFFQTAGTMFPPLYATDGQLRGSVTLPLMNTSMAGAIIKIQLAVPAAGSPHGAGGLIIQSKGLGGEGAPLTAAEITGRAIDSNLWVAGGSSTVTYTTPLSGKFHYAIKLELAVVYFKLWPDLTTEPTTWEGPGQYAAPDEVRILCDVFSPTGAATFNQDFTFTFSRPVWCTGSGVAGAWYYLWTAPMYIDTADGITAQFMLPADPAGGVLAVRASINGNYEPCTFDSGTRTFTFAYAPHIGDIIDAAWIPIP